jgi:hypothetical protein
MFVDIFGKRYKRNPNTIDVELLETEIKVIYSLVEKYVENQATPEEKAILFYPILSKLQEAVSAENKKKSYEKSLIGETNE